MSAKRLSFDAPLPRSAIYLDTSFILNFIANTQNRQEEFQTKCENFLKRLQSEAESSGLCLATSDFAINEVCYQIIKYELKKKLSSIGDTSRLFRDDPINYYKTNPQIIQQFLPKIERFYTVIEAIPVFIISYPELKEIAEDLYLQAKKLISSYNLLPTDAYHVAMGKSAGIEDFVAVDRDWFRIDNINLYTCLSYP